MPRFLTYNENVRKFLDILRASEDFVSGELIANQLGITRAQIFKIVKKLEKYGYKFEKSRKGYKILNSPDIPFPWEIGENTVFFYKTDSTQERAKLLFENLKIRENTWVLAFTQTKGKGRLGRKWESPEGNFYGSIVLKADIPLKEIVKLSLLGGLSVFRTISDYGVKNAKIKWPNDVWIIQDKPKKISGCIAEAYGEAEKINYVVLGVGVNVKKSPLPESTSLSEVLDKEASLVEFVRKYIQEFENIWKRFLSGFWFELKTEIEQNMWRGKVKVIRDSKEFEGFCSGIAEDGVLLVQKEDASVEKVYYGDILIKF